MMLGDVLDRLSGIPDDEVESALGQDSVLLARLAVAAKAQGQSMACYIRDATCRFLERATEEEWTTAMGRMRSDPAPGDRLIELALEQQLQRDGV